MDLNLLVVFHQLMVERRVSAVADTLGLSQPAVSNALARLRRSFGDELFLRTPRGMEPTPLAEQLAEPVAAALALLQGAVTQRSEFDPSSSTRAFSLGMSDIGEIYFLPTLMDALAHRAPGVTLTTARGAAQPLRVDQHLAMACVCIRRRFGRPCHAVHHLPRGGQAGAAAQ